MRKLAVLVAVLAVLGLTTVTTGDNSVLIAMADTLDLRAMQCSGDLSRAEPLCPLC